MESDRISTPSTFGNLRGRLTQNRVQEKLTKLWSTAACGSSAAAPTRRSRSGRFGDSNLELRRAFVGVFRDRPAGCVRPALNEAVG
jgi:hypothetical protein